MASKQDQMDDLEVLVANLRRSVIEAHEACNRSRQLINESRRIIEKVSSQMEPDYRRLLSAN